MCTGMTCRTFLPTYCRSSGPIRGNGFAQCLTCSKREKQQCGKGFPRSPADNPTGCYPSGSGLVSHVRRVPPLPYQFSGRAASQLGGADHRKSLCLIELHCFSLSLAGQTRAASIGAGGRFEAGRRSALVRGADLWGLNGRPARIFIAAGDKDCRELEGFGTPMLLSSYCTKDAPKMRLPSANNVWQNAGF